jgi:RNA polymerase sigma factor (sigma-70 family)
VSAVTTAGPAFALRDDDALVSAVRAGDESAFGVLYDRYRSRIVSYAQGMLVDHARAEDVTQDVFFSALRRMRETERPIAFKPWIYEIARNACIDQFRRGRRAELVSYEAHELLPGGDRDRLRSHVSDPENAVASKQALSDLCGAFGGLSQAQHDVLVLREFDGLTYEQIGERLGMSRAAVESTLFRARKQLSQEYDQLVSGERCRQTQLIVERATTASLGAREQRLIARHLSHCQPCRRHALAAGMADLPTRRSLRERVAAWLPLPVLFRARRGPASVEQTSAGSSSWMPAIAGNAEPITQWTKAAVATGALLIAGVSTGTTGRVVHRLATATGVAVTDPGTALEPAVPGSWTGASRVRDAGAFTPLFGSSSGDRTSSAAGDGTLGAAGSDAGGGSAWVGSPGTTLGDDTYVPALGAPAVPGTPSAGSAQSVPGEVTYGPTPGAPPAVAAPDSAGVLTQAPSAQAPAVSAPQAHDPALPPVDAAPTTPSTALPSAPQAPAPPSTDVTAPASPGLPGAPGLPTRLLPGF